MIEKACGQDTPLTVDDLATIIFSSGSTGEPKGVMLSHLQFDANAQGASQVLHLYHQERVLGILPFFHSFGYLVFWFVMFNNAAFVFHPSPLDVAAIGEFDAPLARHVSRDHADLSYSSICAVVRRNNSAPCGWCSPALRNSRPGSCRPSKIDSASNRLKATASPNVRPSSPSIVRTSGPLATINRPPGEGPSVNPFPACRCRIVDPDSFTPLPPGTPGMLLVKGPNVMNGYLGREDLTASAMRDGWYITGDIAMLDDDGFLTITDRLSRFSKIGGEMVPHGRVEEALQQAAKSDMQVFAVTGIPDERKGEQLAVLHTLDEARIPDILAKLAANGLPNLFMPPRGEFHQGRALPVLGTGKMDLRSPETNCDGTTRVVKPQMPIDRSTRRADR